MAQKKALHLRATNVGPFENIDVRFPSVTIMAGENGTGKSTISKTAYMLLAFKENIGRLLVSERRRLRTSLSFAAFEAGLEKADAILDDENDRMEAFAKSPKAMKSYEEYKAIKNAHQLDDVSADLAQVIMRRIVDAEFEGQFCHFDKTSAMADLESNGLVASLRCDRNGYEMDPSDLGFGRPLYIESVSCIDNLYSRSREIRLYYDAEIDHASCLSRLLRNAFAHGEEGLFDEMHRNEMIERFDQALHEIINGSFLRDDQRGVLYFKSIEGGDYQLKNVASGIKAFAMLDLLIQYGVLQADSFLILDEPESNLHPKWQLEFARLLVSLASGTDMHILINSHSPMFIEALQLFCSKSLDESDYRLYFTSLDDGGKRSVIQDVTDDSEVIYSSLAAPYKDMDKAWADR